MLDRNLKKVILICGVIIFVALSFTLLTENEDLDDNSADLETVLCRIDGVEEASVVYYYSQGDSSDVLDGIAIIYKGKDDNSVTEKIYELVNALYDLPYNRIYVSH